jgi:hypothetical protein
MRKQFFSGLLFLLLSLVFFTSCKKEQPLTVEQASKTGRRTVAPNQNVFIRSGNKVDGRAVTCYPHPCAVPEMITVILCQLPAQWTAAELFAVSFVQVFRKGVI